MVAKHAKDEKSSVKKVNKNHKIHTMIHQYTRVEDVAIFSLSMTKKQKRIVSHYECSCSEVDTLYREIGKPYMTIHEYKKAVTR